MDKICKNCYGKGYATIAKLGQGEIQDELVYRPCSCPRGKEFNFALEKAKQEGRDEVLRKLKK